MHKEWYDYDATLGECTTCGDTPCTCPPGMIWLGAGGRHQGVCTHRGGHQSFCKGVIHYKGMWIGLPPRTSVVNSVPQPGDVCAECGCLWSAHDSTRNHCYNCGKCKVFSDTHLPHVVTVMAPISVNWVDLEFEERMSADLATKCECGAAKCGSNIHSSWCPQNRKTA